VKFNFTTYISKANGSVKKKQWHPFLQARRAVAGGSDSSSAFRQQECHP
jgi:hypothetical protein